MKKVRAEMADELQIATKYCKSNSDTNADVNKRVLQTLKSKIKTARNVLDLKHVNVLMNETVGNALSDGGADTCLLGFAFRMLEYTDRVASVVDFDESLMIDNPKLAQV